MRYTETFEPSFVHQAHTLCPTEVFGPKHTRETGEHQYTHKDGWTIKGSITEDWYYWVNKFEATHPKLGWVRGDFETVVAAKSRKAYLDFVSKHPPSLWDYHDI